MEIKSYLSHFTKRNIDFSRLRRKSMAKKYGKSRFTKYPITILSEVNQYIKIMRKITCMQLPYFAIDVGSGGSTGGTCPQDFAMNKEVPFLVLENTPFFLRKNSLRSVMPSKFEMLPTSLYSAEWSGDLENFSYP